MVPLVVKHIWNSFLIKLCKYIQITKLFLENNRIIYIQNYSIIINKLITFDPKPLINLLNI